eukprot:TRINITY_DN5597_c0_g1_i1.p1 TRINITY_DN5597_c0_g1~~TRINITY_DN5597_c0_g1_i1.p1  ORF type:complete len:801 (-),score=121.56 TRINITY_DN5597_c0_g1_i1:61-2463(-)
MARTRDSKSGSPHGKTSLETLSRQLNFLQDSIDQLQTQLVSAFDLRPIHPTVKVSRPPSAMSNSSLHEEPVRGVGSEASLDDTAFRGIPHKHGKMTKIEEARSKSQLDSYPRHSSCKERSTVITGIIPSSKHPSPKNGEHCCFGIDKHSLSDSGDLEVGRPNVTAHETDDLAAGSSLIVSHECDTLHAKRPSLASNGSRGPASAPHGSGTLQTRRPSWMSTGSQGVASDRSTVQARRPSWMSTGSQGVASERSFGAQSRASSWSGVSGLFLPNVVEQSESGTASSHRQTDWSAEPCAEDNAFQKAWSLNPNKRRLSLGSREAIKTKSMISLRSLPQLEGWRITLLHPDAWLRVAWDLVMIVTISILAVMLPFQAVYLGERPFRQGWQVLRFTCDASFLVDIVVNLASPWTDGTQVFFTLRESICMYAKSWLCVDLLAAWPLSLSSDRVSIGYQLHWILKLAKCLKLAVSLLPRLQRRCHSLLLPYLKLILPVALVFHFLTCIWGWLLVKDSEDLHLVPIGQRYTADLYWLIMTITTVGFGDITATGMAGQSFSILVMFLSSLYSGFVVSSVSSGMKRVFDDQHELCMLQAGKLMSSHKVPRELQRRVEHFLSQRQDGSSLSNPSKLFPLLSQNLHKELVIELLRPTFLAFPLFQDGPDSFIAQLAQAHVWIEAQDGDLVAEEGQIEEELVFVIQGCLYMLRDTNQEKALCDMQMLQEIALDPGSWFGERSLFVRHSICEATIVAGAASELAMLRSDEFSRVLAQYPAIQETHEDMRKAISLRKLDLTELEYIGKMRSGES